MSTIVLVLIIAITVEALIEYAKTVAKAVLEKQYKVGITQGVAIIVSVLLCFAVEVDFYAALGVTFAAPWIGILLTGIFASRGANFVSDLFKKLQSLSTSAAQ